MVSFLEMVFMRFYQKIQPLNECGDDKSFNGKEYTCIYFAFHPLKMVEFLDKFGRYNLLIMKIIFTKFGLKLVHLPLKSRCV